MSAARALASYAAMNTFVACAPKKESHVIDYPDQRRAPGGLKLAVLFAVGEGYTTSGRIAELLDTSRDNVNGALSRLLEDSYVARWDQMPVSWQITNLGRQKLKCDLWEVSE